MAKNNKGKKRANKAARKRDFSANIKADINGIGKGSAGVVYTAPTAATRNVITGQPRMSGGSKSFVIKHREFITDINGAEDFTNAVFPINPGLPAVFAWGSGIAGNYEQYRLRSLAFCYETQAPTTDPGTVMLAIDYDPADTAPGSKSELMAMAGAVRTAVWNRVAVVATPSRRPFEKLYIRNGALGPNLDIKTYDYGVLNIAVQGSTSATAIGELYVEYEIELLTPALDAAEDELYAHTANTTSVATNRSSPFATSFAVVGGGLAVSSVSASTLLFPTAGDFSIWYRITSGTLTSVHSVAPTVAIPVGEGTVVSNVSWSNDGGNSVSGHVEIAGATAGTELSFNFTPCCDVMTTSFVDMYIRGCNLTAPSPAPLRYTSMKPGQNIVARPRKKEDPHRCASSTGGSSTSSCSHDALPVPLFTDQELLDSRNRLLAEVRRALSTLNCSLGPSNGDGQEPR